MRAHRVVVLFFAVGAAAACAYSSVGDGSSPVVSNEGGVDGSTGPGPGEEGGTGPAQEAGNGGPDATTDAPPAVCGPGNCEGCCDGVQCEPGTGDGFCGHGGVACGPCDDSGSPPDAGDGGRPDAEPPDAGKDAAPPDAGRDSGPPDAGGGLPFGAPCTLSTQCGAPFPDCETVTTDSGVKTICTKACGVALKDAGTCPVPPTNGVCGSVGYCE
jgi:hypothetical protein